MAGMREYRGHASHCTCVRWSAEDIWVCSVGSRDRTVIQWRLSRDLADIAHSRADTWREAASEAAGESCRTSFTEFFIVS